MARMNWKSAAMALTLCCAWPMAVLAGLRDIRESNHFVDITVDTKEGYASVRLKDSDSAKEIYEALQVAPTVNPEGISVKTIDTVQPPGPNGQRMQFVCWKNATAPYGCEISMSLASEGKGAFRVHLSGNDKRLILRTDSEAYAAARVLDQALPKDEGRVEVAAGTDPHAGTSVNGGLAYIVPPDPLPGPGKKPRFQLKSIRDEKNNKTFFEFIVTRPLKLAAAEKSVAGEVERSSVLTGTAAWR